jgi:hypothetical protein
MVLSLTFSGSFGATQNIYGYAADLGGLNSGWQAEGTTGTIANTPPSADSVTGIANGSANQTLTFQYSSGMCCKPEIRSARKNFSRR